MPTGIYDRKPLSERFWSKVTVEGDCWVWTAFTTEKGYGKLSGKRAHRISWELTNGPIPDGMFICHICDNPSCVRPDHLFMGTHADNVADAVKKNRYANGEANGRNRFSTLQVEQMRQMVKAGMSQTEVAERFKTSQGYVSHVVNKHYWK